MIANTIFCLCLLIMIWFTLLIFVRVHYKQKSIFNCLFVHLLGQASSHILCIFGKGERYDL